VIGAEGLGELAILTHGDFTVVKQRVELTGFDLVSATMETIGAIMGVSQPLAGFPAHNDALFWFDFNAGSDAVPNLVENAFPLASDGSMEVGTETYSPNAQYCRVIPEGVGLARMLGGNTPQAFPPALTDYTFQFWINFDTSVYASSTGISGQVFSASGSNGRFIVRLNGVAASHEWFFSVEHYDGISAEVFSIDSFLIDAPLGWKMFSIRYRAAETQPDQCELYMDDTLVGASTDTFTIDPASPEAGAEIYYGDSLLVGDYDAMRLLSVALSPSEIAASYNACIANPSEVEYQWLMEILLDGVLYAQRTIVADERRTWEDFTAPCRLITGETEVAFRLKLERLL